MSADFMTVRLHLPGVRVTGVVVDTPTELVVGVVSVKKLSKCPQCGCSCRRVHDRRQREIRDLEHGGRRTVLLWTQRRLVCDHCGKRHIETHPQFEGCMTRRLARRLVQDAQVMPIRAVSRRHRISWHLIMELVTDWSGRVEVRRRRQKCRVLLIDETSIRKRHRYVTVVVNGDTGEVLAMFPERSKAALSRFFIEQGPRWCHSVRTVVTDGSRLLPSSDPVVSSRSPSRPGPVPRHPMVRPRTDPGTKRTATPPTPRSETRLRTRPVPRPVLSAEKKRPSHPPPTNDASSGCSLFIPVSRWPGTPYKSSTACTRPTISKAPSKPSTVSGTSTTAEQIPEYHDTVDTILNWIEEILAWHHDRRSNGPLEGINNLLQTLRRTAHGFTNPQNYAARGLLLT